MAQQSLSIVLLEQESQKMPRLEEDFSYPKVGRLVGMVPIQHCSGHVRRFILLRQANAFLLIYQYMRDSDAHTVHIQQEMSSYNGRYEAPYLSINLIKHGMASFLDMICLNSSQIRFEHSNCLNKNKPF